MNLPKLIKQALRSIPPLELLKVTCENYEPYYHLMYLIASQLDNAFCVELGVHKGRGLAAMAMASRQNLVIGFDTVQWPGIEIVLEHYKNIIFMQKASLPVPIDINRPINLLHIDTEHSYAMVEAEFEAYKNYLADGAVVLFDDLHAMDNGVLDYFESLPYPKWQDDRLHPVCGYGVLLYGQ